MRTRRVTSLDVARRAGVSRTTVSLVLNKVEGSQISPGTAERVFQAAQELGYVPDAAAQALASRKSQLVGLVLFRQRQDVGGDVVLLPLIEGVLDTLNPAGMRLLLDVVEENFDQDSYLQLVRARHVDGMLIAGPRFNDEAIARLVADEFPAVLIGRMPGSDFYTVDVDNICSAQTATRHLIELGHRRIACITNAHIPYITALDRLQGYRQALEAAELPYDEELVRYGDFGPQSGYQQMHALLDAGASFTAAFIASDVVAYGAMAALNERGLRVPQDVAIVGFDDLPLSSFTNPPLTSIHLPINDLARQASRHLLALLRGESPPKRQTTLETHLVVRQSCGGVPEDPVKGGEQKKRD